MIRRSLMTRRLILAGIAVAGLVAFRTLGLDPSTVVPSRDELATLSSFLLHSISPALTYEAAFVPDGAPSLLAQVADAARRTAVLAAASMSLALVGGMMLGFLSSTAWWRADNVGGGLLSRTLFPFVYATTRVLIAVMRSIHELLWALIFLVAIGLTDLGAVIAIALPYAGTLAKVFSELIDETPDDAAHALRGAGATPSQVYLFGLVPRALPDMGAYALYRFECALRSSAVLGFFGPETLGKFIKLAWDENHYAEVWTYLYALFGLILIIEWWSGALRSRFAR
jgi:phosphonate transport system permease protein